MAIDLQNQVNEIDGRVTKVEEKVDKVSDEVTGIKVTCAGSMANIEAKITNALAQNQSTLKLLKWVVIIAVSVVSALTGIKIVDPGLLSFGS